MAQNKSLIYYIAVIVIILSALTHETEARRKILRGRHVMTRTYYHGNAIPAWAISLIAGIGMLAIGGILYVVMRKLVVSSETVPINSYQPAMQNDV